MKFITVKSKQTTASVDLVPPLVLGDKQRVSLVDIRIPEQYFEFTDYESIGTDGRYGNKINIILFSKHLGKYNARRLQASSQWRLAESRTWSRNNNNRQGCLSDNTIKGSYCFTGINQKF